MKSLQFTQIIKMETNRVANVMQFFIKTETDSTIIPYGHKNLICVKREKNLPQSVKRRFLCHSRNSFNFSLASLLKLSQ